MLTLLGAVSYFLGRPSVTEVPRDSVWCEIFPPPTEKLEEPQTRSEAFCAVILGGEEGRPERLLLHEIEYNEKAEPVTRSTKNCIVTQEGLDRDCLPDSVKRGKENKLNFEFKQGSTPDESREIVVGKKTYILKLLRPLNDEEQPWDERQGRMTHIPLVYSSTEPAISLFKPERQDKWYSKTD
ncbi:hypothetical protein Pmar_PMAR013180, partial [Perkinsus marinus ATCC 50983]